MPDPIVVTVTATPDPNTQDTLIVSIDQPTVFLSLEDLDQVRWVCQGGSVEIVFASATNPFDPSASSGGQYQTQANGSLISGTLVAGQLDADEEVFNTYKYSIVVRSFDGQRAGSLDPRIKGRRRRVYHRSDIDD
ncbi:MAG: hypothetical protein AB7U82_29720 [Blastocatellales bacterium]